jgi:hypothetical protein
MTQLGKIYIAPGGMQLIVTKGGPGVLSDGDVTLLRADSGEKFPEDTKAATTEPTRPVIPATTYWDIVILLEKAFRLRTCGPRGAGQSARPHPPERPVSRTGGGTST